MDLNANLDARNCHNRGGCCSESHLRDEGIKKTTTPGVYFADADLECEFGCFGSDNDTIYEWTLLPISGNVSIVGNPVKIGNDRVQVAGNGTFYLHVRVTFICRENNPPPDNDVCNVTATVKFTQ